MTRLHFEPGTLGSHGSPTSNRRRSSPVWPLVPPVVCGPAMALLGVGVCGGPRGQEDGGPGPAQPQPGRQKVQRAAERRICGPAVRGVHHDEAALPGERRGAGRRLYWGTAGYRHLQPTRSQARTGQSKPAEILPENSSPIT